MPFMVADLDKEEIEMQRMIDENPELAEFARKWDEEYERRKRLALTHKSPEIDSAQLVVE